MTPNKLPPLPEPVTVSRDDLSQLIDFMFSRFGSVADARELPDTLIAPIRRMEAALALRQSQSLPAGAVAGLSAKVTFAAIGVVEMHVDQSYFGPHMIGEGDEVIILKKSAIQADAREKGEAVAWLIEETTGGTRWYSGAGEKHQTFGEDGGSWEEMLCRVWTKDSTKAIRFARKSDAERMMRALGFDNPAHFAATEHVWLATQPAQASEKVAWRMFDRVDFALRDAGIDLDLSAWLAGMADEYVGTKATNPQPVTPAGDVPFATVREVVKALTRLGTSTPESQEEQAARAVELIGLLCREVHGHFDELSKVTPEGGEFVYAVNTGELDESGKRELYTLTDAPIPMADNWKLYTHPPVADAALPRGHSISDAKQALGVDESLNIEALRGLLSIYEKCPATGQREVIALKAAIAALNQRGGA